MSGANPNETTTGQAQDLQAGATAPVTTTTTTTQTTQTTQTPETTTPDVAPSLPRRAFNFVTAPVRLLANGVLALLNGVLQVGKYILNLPVRAATGAYRALFGAPATPAPTTTPATNAAAATTTATADAPTQETTPIAQPGLITRTWNRLPNLGVSAVLRSIGNLFSRMLNGVRSIFGGSVATQVTAQTGATNQQPATTTATATTAATNAPVPAPTTTTPVPTNTAPALTTTVPTPTTTVTAATNQQPAATTPLTTVDTNVPAPTTTAQKSTVHDDLLGELESEGKKLVNVVEDDLETVEDAFLKSTSGTHSSPSTATSGATDSSTPQPKKTNSPLVSGITSLGNEVNNLLYRAEELDTIKTTKNSGKSLGWAQQQQQQQASSLQQMAGVASNNNSAQQQQQDQVRSKSPTFGV